MTDYISDYTVSKGTDFNHYQSVAFTNADYEAVPQVLIRFKGPQRLMFICTAGTDIEYSFNGITTHGVMSSSAPQNYFNFGPRDNKKIWFKGTGTVRVHAWQCHR